MSVRISNHHYCCFEYAPYDGDILYQRQKCVNLVNSRYSIKQIVIEVAILSAGKIFHSEYIVPHGYNVTGNGERDMHSERISAMVRKYAVGHMWKR